MARTLIASGAGLVAISKTSRQALTQAAFDAIDADGFSGSQTEDWLLVRRTLERADADELKRTGDHARYLRLLRRGSAIEDQLAELWKQNGKTLAPKPRWTMRSFKIS